MSSAKVPAELRELVRQLASYSCEYCQTNESISGIAGQIDHIIPVSGGGSTTMANLCLACAACNSRKWAWTEGIDPESGKTVLLFHPRQQRWDEHFAWSEDGRTIMGLTACGRATVATLQMNHPLIMAARNIWVRVGLHPP